jgi:hypothetical protein
MTAYILFLLLSRALWRRRDIVDPAVFALDLIGYFDLPRAAH